MTTSALLRPDQWLAMQPPDFRAALTSCSQRRTLPAGMPLYRAEEWGGIYSVISGCLEVSVQFSCSSLTGLHFAYPGYFVGNRPLNVGVPYVVSVSARLASEVDLLPFAQIGQMVAQRPEWWRCFATMTDYWFDVATCGGLDLMLRRSEARCIAVLLRLGGYRPFLEIDETPRLVPITQAELAENANLSRTRVSQILGRLEAAGLIERQYAGISVSRPGSLEARLEALVE